MSKTEATAEPKIKENELKTTAKNRCKNKAACPELPGGSAARAVAPLTHLIISSRLVFVSFLSCLPRSRLRFVRKSKRLLKNADRSIAKATDATHIAVRRSLVSGCESKLPQAKFRTWLRRGVSAYGVNAYLWAHAETISEINKKRTQIDHGCIPALGPPSSTQKY